MPESPVNPLINIMATKPHGKIARLLTELGITIVPQDEDLGNMERFILSKRTAIERRTGSSFIRGIQDKTLFTHAIDLREQFEIPILILEGDVNYEYSGFHPQAVRGAMTALVLIYGITILASPDSDETARLIAMAARHEQVGVPEISLTPKRKTVNLPDMQRRVIEMLPGCSMAASKDLLQHFGSIRQIVDASEDELREVRGIGAQKAAEIVRIFNAEYEAIEVERHLEDAIQASPSLLFEEDVILVARQHHLYSDQGERHIIDMVFHDPKNHILYLVELKLGKLVKEHYLQIRRYLDHVVESPLLRGYLAAGDVVRGMLATIEPCSLNSDDKDVLVHIVNPLDAIRVLKRLRAV
jgi:ERCC4-type nuclease